MPPVQSDSLDSPSRFSASSVDKLSFADISIASPGAPFYRCNTNESKASTTMTGRDSLKEIATAAIAHEKVELGDGVLPPFENLRDSIRLIHAYSIRDFPFNCIRTGKVKIKGVDHQMGMGRDLIFWMHNGKSKGSINTDDIFAAELLREGKKMRFHVYLKGKGKGMKRLKRRHKKYEFEVADRNEAQEWVDAVRDLVLWQARVAEGCVRKLKVVVNPHSGKRRALKIWNDEVKPILELAQIKYDLETTTYGGHAIDMGREYSPDAGYEALVFVSGDGTICEYMNGLLARPEAEWREVVQKTPLSLISAGTQNAFGTGVGIPTTAAALYSIIKRKLRPLDVITATAADDKNTVHYSCCGLGWGVAGDIAAQSESHRWMGTKRYAFLKLKLAVLFPKKHTGTIKYVPADPQPPLRRYDDIRNHGIEDQHRTELGSVYDKNSSNRERSWSGLAGAVRDPGNMSRWPEEKWTVESGKYVAVGLLNTVPDGIYTHPSDGCMDLLIARKGGICASLKLGIYYLMGKELDSELMSYIKVKAARIEQNQEEGDNVMNIDGEVLPGPGPWNMEIVPSLFKVLSEK